MCFGSIGCSKEPSHRDISFEHTKHFLGLRNKKKILLNTLIWGPVTNLITFLLISLKICFGVQTRIVRESDYSSTEALFMQ